MLEDSTPPRSSTPFRVVVYDVPLHEHYRIYYSVNLLMAAHLCTLMKDNWYLGKWQPTTRATLDRAKSSSTMARSDMPRLGNAAP